MTRRSLPILAAALAVLAADAAQASGPVPRQITGCVTRGVLISADGYRISVRRASDREAFDLSAYEGRQIRFDGNLLPGDVYYVRGEPAVLGPCPTGGALRQRS